jgi:hypothetical protein
MNWDKENCNEDEDDPYNLFESVEYKDEDTELRKKVDEFMQLGEEFDLDTHIEQLIYFMTFELAISMDFARHLVNSILPENYDEMVFEVKNLHDEIQKGIDDGSLITEINEDGEITYQGKPK